MSLTLSSAGSDDMFCFVAVNSKTCNGNSTPREGQCIQMESQRRFRAVKRSSAIAEAAKSDPIGWSASRPCVNNFGLWYFAGRGGVRRPSPVDGHGPFATADAASSGRWPPEAPSPKSRSISGQDQRHCSHGGVRFQTRVGVSIDHGCSVGLQRHRRCKARPFEVLMLKTYLGIDAQYIARHTENVSSCLNLGDLSKASPGNSPFVQAAPFLRCNDIRRLVFWRRG